MTVRPAEFRFETTAILGVNLAGRASTPTAPPIPAPPPATTPEVPPSLADTVPVTDVTDLVQ
jgi:hypothetical protein